MKKIWEELRLLLAEKLLDLALDVVPVYTEDGIFMVRIIGMYFKEIVARQKVRLEKAGL